MPPGGGGGHTLQMASSLFVVILWFVIKLYLSTESWDHKGGEEVGGCLIEMGHLYT